VEEQLHALTLALDVGARYEAFTEVKIQVEVFSDVTPCSVVVGYQRFGSPRCLHLQTEARRHMLKTSTYMKVSGQLHAPAALPPGKELPVPAG
jgi:hypothetical protein